MDKMKIIFGFEICALVMVVSVMFIDDMGSLLDHTITGAFMILVGVIAIICFVIPDKNKKRDKKDKFAVIIAIVFGVLCCAIGVRDLAHSAIDTANGPQMISLTGCTVTESGSMRSLDSSFYLEGVDSHGDDVKYSINRDTYYRLEGEYGFSVDILGWEKSKVVKVIYK